MDFRTYSKKFTEGATKAGYSSSQIITCLEYAERLFQTNVPVIYNSDHLSALVGYSKSYLKRAVSYPKSFYRSFYISKKKGGVRELSEPLPSLKEIQNWILQNILYKVGIHPYAKAYAPGLTIKDNFKYHKKKNEIISLDITNFFGSIAFHRIEAIFRELGYTPIIANLLSKLVTLNQTLAQGAPTSPYLSNLVMRDFDSAIEKFCKENALMFTRYADDLTFSGKDLDMTKIVNAVNLELSKIGLKLNQRKTRHMPKNRRQIVTGVVLNNKPQIKRRERKLIRQEIYYIRKFGLKEHMKGRNITNANYLKHLLGKINYALFINPSDTEMTTNKEFILKIFNNS